MTQRREDVPVVTAVDDAGVVVATQRPLLVDVGFDGRRVWSFRLPRDGEPVPGGQRVRWPAPLVPLLHGRVRLRLGEHGDHPPFHDAEVALGSASDGRRIQVVAADGGLLALDKSRRLVRTFDTRTSDQVAPLLDAVEDVLAVLRAEGVEAFLAYGTALGAIRDGRLIGHDSDADLGYLSAHGHPVDVIRESFALHRALVRRGHRVTRHSSAAFKVEVTESDGARRGLDVFGGFLRDGQLHLMGEIRAPFRREWVLPLGETVLEGRSFPVPADADRFLSATYGPSWRTPDPAFRFVTPTATRRRLKGWFRGTRVRRRHWDQVYAEPGAEPPVPSAFAHWVLDRSDAGTVVDLGCGRGADVLAYARAGRRAVGLDFVPRGYTGAADQARRDRLAADFEVVNLLELRSVLPTCAALAGRQLGPCTVTARHLVEELTAEGRAGLWRAADMLTRGGGGLALELLTRSGADGYADRTFHGPMGPLRPAVVARELEAVGATVVGRRTVDVPAAAPGLRPSRVCRMMAQWTR